MCESLHVTTEAPLRDPWVEASERACRELAELLDRDQSARIRLISDADDVLVEVILADGRSAIRRVREPARLAPTLTALVSLPPATANDPRARSTAPVALPPPALVPPTEPKRATTISVEIALSVAGRITASDDASIAPTVEASLVADRWLFGLWARWDVVSLSDVANPADFEQEGVGAGVSVARRTNLGAVDLDIGASPRFIEDTQRYIVNGTEEARSAADIRLGAFVRAAFGHRALRFITTLDGELSPARLRRPIQLESDLPALPAWSAGLAAGVAWTSP